MADDAGWYAMRGYYDPPQDRLAVRFGDPLVGTVAGIFHGKTDSLDIEFHATPGGKLVELLVHSASASMPPAALKNWTGVEYGMLHDGSIWVGLYEGAGAVQRLRQDVNLTEVGFKVILGFNGADRLVGLTIPDAESCLEGAPLGLPRPSRPGEAFGL